jgi:hypothetical protein
MARGKPKGLLVRGHGVVDRVGVEPATSAVQTRGYGRHWQGSRLSASPAEAFCDR